MNKELLEIRKVKKEDAREWFVFGFKIWRDTYKNIFPEEVFIDRESKLEEKVKDFVKLGIGYPEVFYTYKLK